jgi:hypothetical protein
MMGRLPGLLAVLVVLAGCGAGPFATPEPTVTPVPVPEGDRGSLAPGVSDEGVERPGVLAAAHADALTNRSYRLVTSRTVRYENGTLRERLRLELALSADRHYLVDAETAGPEAPVFIGKPPATATFWSNGSTYTRRLTRDGETTYTRFQPTDGAGTWQYWARTVPFGGRQGSPRNFVEETFTTVPTSITGRTAVGNTTAYGLAGTRATDPLPGVDEPHSVVLRATVTADGLVKSVTLRYAGTVDGEAVSVERTVRYEGVGNTTVGRPAWTDRALGQSD